ncbi:hypothetical protein [Candidatus Electronema sp. TJ]|uniref:hypothetical protein n=1 Tax=Candidatus Electronema sp. TJ TaxID=3401573 RepID=UPI003AA87E6B
MIVEEIRKGREEHAAQFNYNVKAIVKALQEEERKSGRKIVSFADKSDKNTAKSH